MRDSPAVIIRSVLFVSVFLMSASASAGPLSDRIYRSLKDGDTQQMYRNVRLVFEEMGLVFSSGLTFRTQPYDAPSAWYHGVFNDITYPRLMLPEESHHYWTTLSRRLTDGAWKPGEIFKDEKE